MRLSPRFLCPFRVPNLSFVKRDGFSVRVTKITSMICVSWTHRLPFWFWSIFNSMKWPYYQNGKFEWCDSLNCSFTNKVFVRILLNVNLSLNQTLLTSVLYVRQLGWLNWFGNFSVRCCLPVIQKDSATHMGGLAVYVRERLPCAGDLSLENSVDSLCFQLALLHSVLLLFSLT